MKFFQILIAAVLLAGVSLVSAQRPDVVEAGGAGIHFLWDQVGNGLFYPELDSGFGEQASAWTAFLRSDGEEIVKRFYSAEPFVSGAKSATYHGRGKFLNIVYGQDKNVYVLGSTGKDYRIAMARELVNSFAEKQALKRAQEEAERDQRAKEEMKWAQDLSIGRGGSSSGWF
ncbi:conserved hypothetical Ustilaginaceae-specific protein [Sporisorium reilianum SRZ2]|uniref:Conserved hypothetical Ustilaginaceae-specific protein n=1 Tax=Sporisorium reilianum (strain SRZ2) TaxID=999809 RepID=E7A096_SPORE|nr:conserved hypothetical Ustilaginaceae-specific protein [Sporisorium reilianum SRZ2]